MRRLLLAAISLIAACSTSPAIRGVTSDGEVFNGVATANGQWDTSGTLQFVSARGVNCVGRFVYEGIAGPRGKASYTCSDGRSGEAALMMKTMDSGTGQGNLGSQRINFTWQP